MLAHNRTEGVQMSDGVYRRTFAFPAGTHVAFRGAATAFRSQTSGGPNRPGTSLRPDEGRWLRVGLPLGLSAAALRLLGE
jgi:hypothetical protein